MSVNETMSVPRVALLASPGVAREKLRLALQEAGAEIVLEDDPANIDDAVLAGSAPRAVLIALDPAVEESLSRFEQALSDPAVAVIFDEAELAMSREGWEARRWIRHLSAKLHGHRNVLPPGHEEELVLEPGLPLSPSQIHDGASIVLHLEEAEGLAQDLPRDGFVTLEAGHAAGDDGLIDADAWLRAAAVPVPLAVEPAVVDEPDPVPLRAQEEPGPVAPPAPGFDINSLTLVDLEPVAAARTPGAVVVLAGVGGPDAVRKLLSGLPADFTRPVLVCVRLDGGRYDNLVKQMARISQMPVALAEAGKAAEAGNVYVLPDDIVGAVAGGGVDFREGKDIGGMIRELPPAESAVLILSGGDMAQVPVAWALAGQGAYVAGQAPQGCYDPAASRALGDCGAELGAPAELARQLIERWG